MNKTLSIFSSIFLLLSTTPAHAVTEAPAGGLPTTQLPSLSVDDVTIDESAGVAVVDVRLSAASSNRISVTVFTTAESALPGVDYFGGHRQLSFSAGEQSKQFEVQILDDTEAEATERFGVGLGGATNAVIADGSANVTISDNDDAEKPVITVDDVEIAENAGFAVSTLTLSAPASSPVSVTVSTEAETASPGSDYYGATSRITFDVGQVSAQFNVQILDDGVAENAETLAINLANASANSTIGRQKAQIVITDDDANDPLTRSIFVPLQAEDFDAMQGVRTFPGGIGYVSQDDWVRFDNVDFGDGATQIRTRLAVPASNAGGRIELRLGSLDSAAIGTLVVTATGGWDTYQTQSTNITRISGTHDLYVSFSGNDGIANIDWFAFSPRSASAPQRAVTADLFGMHAHTIGFDGEWPTVPFAVYRIHDTAGAFWRDIEPSQNQWNWQQFDRVVELAETNRAELLYTLGQTPAWAALDPDSESAYNVPGSSSRPRSIEDWRDYVRTVVTRYRGRIRYYELWNEVDQPGFYQGELSYLVTMAREAQQIIATVDPGAELIAPSFVANASGIALLDQYLQLGGGDYSKIINVHFYLPGISPPEEIPEVVAEVRKVMAKHGQGAKALWNSESNFGYFQDGQLITGDDALGYVARAYLVQWQMDVARHYWYAWENRNFVGIRFVDPATGLPTPAVAAYRTIQDWMIGKTMQGCRVDNSESWVCELTDSSSRQILIVWNRVGTAPFRLPDRATTLRRLTGERETVSGGTVIDLSVKPVYIELSQ